MHHDAPIAAARPAVIDEVFDGEAVLVHLRTGLYYALTPAATVLWRLLGDGRSPAAVAAATGRRPAEVAAFADALVAEQLAVPAAAEADPPPATAVPPGAPALQRFSDMQDMLMLDPIHDLDLDADGWPVGREGTVVEPSA
jgi:hypothetical protein